MESLNLDSLKFFFLEKRRKDITIELQLFEFPELGFPIPQDEDGSTQNFEFLVTKITPKMKAWLSRKLFPVSIKVAREAETVFIRIREEVSH